MKRPDHILRRLNRAGYQAYYVGGCVRDSLLGRPIHDWDMTTAALPEQVMALFPKTVPTGIKHGTVTVLDKGQAYEITTFRADGDYADGRHPEDVRFVPSLEEDLARRDFTVNAMAMDADGKLYDPMNGQDDLNRKLLRAVGDPTRRFTEDALRMLRGLRFSAQLSFELEERTMAAIAACAPLCDKLSAERVRDEVEKTLLTSYPQMVGKMAELGLLEKFLPKQMRNCDGIGTCPMERTVRWTALCRIYPELDLTALRLDKKTAKDAMAVARLEQPYDRQAWKQLLSEQGRERGLLAADLFGARMTVEEILASGECLWLGDLAVTGRDLPQISGTALGQTLKRLLTHVLTHPADNRKEVLLQLAEKME